MSWLSDILHGRNGDVSKTKVTGVIATVGGLVAMVWPPLGQWVVAHGSELIVSLSGLLGIFLKDAADKTAAPGSAATPSSTPSTS